MLWHLHFGCSNLFKSLGEQTQKVTEGGTNQTKQRWKIMSWAEHPYPPNKKSRGQFKKHWDTTCTHFAMTTYLQHVHDYLSASAKAATKTGKTPSTAIHQENMYESNTIILCSVHVSDDAFAIHSCHWGLYIPALLIQVQVMMQVNCSHIL